MKHSIFGIGLIALFSALPALGEVHVQAGGGFFKPTGDSARFFDNGYRLEAGAEWGFTPNLALMLAGAYNRNKVDGEEVKRSSGLPASFSVDGTAQIYELSLLPKLYLVNTEILGAYFVAGGGPRWFKRKTTISRPDPAPDIVRESNPRSLGLEFGFGVDMAFPGGLRLGLNPGYHLIYDDDNRRQYAVLTIYLKL